MVEYIEKWSIYCPITSFILDKIKCCPPLQFDVISE